MKVLYYWSKVIKKLRGKSIISSNINKTSKVEAGSQVVESNIDKHSFCGYDCQLINCEIGAFTSIGNRVSMGGGRHPLEWVAMSPVFYEGRDSVKTKFSIHNRTPTQRIFVGHDVWIGENVMVKQGVTIGIGAVVGMGSIVTKDVEPYAIVAGNPARLIRKRFDESTIDKLIKSQWWDFEEDKLRIYAKYITEPHIFIEKLGL